jgi:signal transduction histidine kinase
VSEHPTIAELREIDLFTELTDEQLAEWAEVAEVKTATAGSLIYDPEDGNIAVRLLFEGEIQIMFLMDGRTEPGPRQVAPTWLGAIPVLTESPMAGRLQAGTDLRFADILPEPFTDMVLRYPTVFRRVMRQVRPVANRIAAAEHNRERLASLGTMAAGLTHELNNPAAAARRAASDLVDALEVLASTVGHFVEAGIERSTAQELVELQREAIARLQAEDDAPTGLEAADLEDELTDVLDELGVAEPYRIAPPLVAARIDRAWLERLAAVAGPATMPAIAWVAASLNARGLASELCESTDRMSTLVKAVKAYAYMDRGDIVEADVHEGLKTTLMVLGHKLKHTSIKVEKHLDKTLPKIMIRGGEMNQVWTNLLANAIEALGESGTITISTQLDGPCIRVDIADDGPGISPENLDRIFDPFFTTKVVGQGTGLGLDTARRIVEERHRGTLGVESQPGNTVFHVWLPLDGVSQAPRA